MKKSNRDLNKIKGYAPNADFRILLVRKPKINNNNFKNLKLKVKERKTNSSLNTVPKRKDIKARKPKQMTRSKFSL